MHVDSILLKKPYLKLVTDDLYGISDRIKAIDPSYFIVRNMRTGNYEVHSTKSRDWNTHCLTVPYVELDSRTLNYCLETSLAIHGDRIERDIEEHNRKIDEAKEREYRRTLHDASLETAEMTAFGIDQDELHEGYRKTHYMGVTKNES